MTAPVLEVAEPGSAPPPVPPGPRGDPDRETFRNLVLGVLSEASRGEPDEGITTEHLLDAVANRWPDDGYGESEAEKLAFAMELFKAEKKRADNCRRNGKPHWMHGVTARSRRWKLNSRLAVPAIEPANDNPTIEGALP